MFDVNTGLYVILGGPNLGVLAHGYKYYLANWVFCGELLAVPEAQCGPRCLYLCVCMCVVHTAISVCIDLFIRQVHTAISVCMDFLIQQDME